MYLEELPKLNLCARSMATYIILIVHLMVNDLALATWYKKKQKMLHVVQLDRSRGTTGRATGP